MNSQNKYTLQHTPTLWYAMHCTLTLTQFKLDYTHIEHKYKIWWFRQQVSALIQMTTICLVHCNTSPSHRVDQVVDCGLWNIGPLLFNGCANLLDIGRNWNTLSYTAIQQSKHAQWVTCPVSMMAMQELECFQLPGIVYRSLQHGAVHYHAAT